jgi:collagenase-like PrtC family protease
MVELPDIAAMGVAGLRLSPQRCDMVAVAGIYDDVRKARIEPAAGLTRLKQIYPDSPFCNGFFHGVEGTRWVDADATMTARAAS